MTKEIKSKVISIREIEEYRRSKWRLSPKLRIKSEKGAVNFIDDVGMSLLFSCKDIPLPKMSESAKSDTWDWWEWKDTLQAKKKWYNSRVIKKKSTLLSMELLPYFLSIYYSTGGCEVYEEEYYYGRLTEPAYRIADYLYHHKSTSIDDLRKTLAEPGKTGTRKFHKSIQELQMKFKIAVSGLVDKHWGVRVIDLFSNWAPGEILKKAESIDPEKAREFIIEKYIETSGITTSRQIRSLFDWHEESVNGCINQLLKQDRIHKVTLKNQKEEFLSIL